MLGLFGRRKGHNISTINYKDASKRRKAQLFHRTISVFLTFAFVCMSVVGVATFVNFANAKQEKAGTVDLSMDGTSDYGTGGGTGHYQVERDGNTYTAVCGQPWLDRPSLGNHSSEKIIIDADSMSKYNLIKYMFIMYKYAPSKLDNLKNAMGISRYAALHAIVSYLYNGQTSTSMRNQSGYNFSTAAYDTAAAMVAAAKQDIREDGVFELNGKSISLLRFDIFVIRVEGKQDMLWVEESPRAKAKIIKKDADTNTSTPQGDAKLSGAKFQFYEDKNGAPGQEVSKLDGTTAVLVTGANGETPASQAIFPVPGDYWIRETEVPEGYNAMVPNPKKISFTEDDEGETVEFTVSDSVKRGGLKIYKCDDESRKCFPLGGASFVGIAFDIINRSANTSYTNIDGSGRKACAVGAVCGRITIGENNVDANGWYAKTASNDALPYGTYEVKEVDPQGRTNPQNFSNGKGYYFTDATRSRTLQVRQHNYEYVLNGDNSAYNKVRRGDVHFQKKIEDCADPSLNGSALKFAPFLLVSRTNGEAHILITNKNGIAGTGMTPDLIDDDYIAQKYKYHTNENDSVLGNQLSTATSDCAKAVKALTTASSEDTAAARTTNAKLVSAVQASCTITSANETTYLNEAHAQYRVWFGKDIKGNSAPVDNNRSGALPYDEYYLVELRTSKTTDLKLQLASTRVSVEKNGQNVDLGTIDDVPECIEECELVELIKDSDPTPGSYVNPGDIITYRLKYSNIGSKDLTNAGIRDVIPEGTTYVEGSANLGGYYNKEQNSVDWKNLNIKIGKSIIVTFKVKVNGAVSNKEQAKSASAHAAVQDCEGSTSGNGSGSGGNDGPRVITNQALYAADWDGTDDPENESNIIEHKKNVTHGYCLTVYKESNPVSGSQVGVPGNSAGLPSEITYTLPATNTGSNVVPFTRIRDYIPEGTVYKEGSVSAGGVYNAEGNYVEWVLKDIQPNTTNRSAYYTVTVAANETTGEALLDHIYNTALYESGKNDPGKPGTPGLPDPGKETNKVVHWTKTPPPCLLNGIKNSTPVPGTEVHTGDIITYHLTLKNNGGQACTKAMIRDYIPRHTAYVSGSADKGGTFDKKTNAVYWENLRVEPAGGTITVNFKVQVGAGIGKASVLNQFDYGEGNLDNTSNIVEHPTNLTPLAPKTGTERAVTLATGFSGLTGIILAALYFAKRHFTRRSFRL